MLGPYRNRNALILQALSKHRQRYWEGSQCLCPAAPQTEGLPLFAGRRVVSAESLVPSPPLPFYSGFARKV
jgi:hypothetical protein